MNITPGTSLATHRLHSQCKPTNLPFCAETAFQFYSHASISLIRLFDDIVLAIFLSVFLSNGGVLVSSPSGYRPWKSACETRLPALISEETTSASVSLSLSLHSLLPPTNNNHFPWMEHQWSHLNKIWDSGNLNWRHDQSPNFTLNRGTRVPSVSALRVIEAVFFSYSGSRDIPLFVFQFPMRSV